MIRPFAEFSEHAFVTVENVFEITYLVYGNVDWLLYASLIFTSFSLFLLLFDVWQYNFGNNLITKINHSVTK